MSGPAARTLLSSLIQAPVEEGSQVLLDHCDDPLLNLKKKEEEEKVISALLVLVSVFYRAHLCTNGAPG